MRVRRGPKTLYDKPMVRTGICITAEQRDGLHRLARTLGISMNALIRGLIDGALAEAKRPADAKKRRRRE